MLVRFLPCPRKLPGTRGHNPKNTYAAWRDNMREARRKLGWPSGRQWRKFRKFGTKAWKAHMAEQLKRGMNVKNPID